MLKKLGVIVVFLISLCVYILGNGLFLGETVKIVKGNKSSGEFLVQTNLPFNEKVGVYKTFNIDYDYFKLIKKYNAKLEYLESVDGVTSYYFYTKKLPYKEVVKNKRVNLQVAVTKEKITIGSPIIYGGY